MFMDYVDDVSEKVVRHIVKRYRDWIEMLDLSSEEVGDFIVRVLSRPSEVYGISEERCKHFCGGLTISSYA
jgi:endonuclease III